MDAYIIDAVRTPRGKAKDTGALHALRPVDLMSRVLNAVASRNELDTDVVDDVVLGCVTQVGDQGANIAKTAALYAGWSDSVPGMTVNRFCSSGLDAIGIAASKITAGMDDVVCAGGVESMSRVPMFGDEGAWFADKEVASATNFVHMGVAADLVASIAGLTREQIDAYAVESHRRASVADFSKSMIRIDDADGELLLDHDELIRRGTSTEKLATLEPLFGEMAVAEPIKRRYPDVELRAVHTIASSPGIADAASALLLASKDRANQLGWYPRARIRSVASVSVEPVQMLHGNISCTQRALDKAGLALDDVDLFEVNESFAAVPLQYQQELDIDPVRLNVCGGAIAMGHPLGATGGILLATLLDALVSCNGAIGVTSICGGAGVATAIVVERV